MANAVYNSFKRDLLGGNISLSADDIYVALVTSDYTVDIDSHTKYSDITNEVSGTGYSTSGLKLSGITLSSDNTDDEGVFDAEDLSWSSSTITARGAVLYKKAGSTTSSPLICYIDFGSDKSSASGTFTIQWNSEGILNLN